MNTREKFIIDSINIVHQINIAKYNLLYLITYWEKCFRLKAIVGTKYKRKYYDDDFLAENVLPNN